MDITCIIGTDIATFALYEPDALRHRASAPWGWYWDHSPTSVDLGDLTVPERTDGRLALIDTATPLHLEDGRVMWVGSDGGYCFRCTTGGLTPDEAHREYPEVRESPAVHTIQVTQERLLLDGCYLIPYDYGREGHHMFSLAQALEQQLAAWLALPNGTYQVTVHHLASAHEDDDTTDDTEVDIVLTFAHVSAVV